MPAVPSQMGLLGFDVRCFVEWTGQCPNPQTIEGEYWWFHPTEWSVSPEPQIVLVRWSRGAVRALYMAGDQRKVIEMRGEWAGPILPPTKE